MNLRTPMLRMTAIIAVVFSFVACEDDFETVGSNVIGAPGFNADLYEDAEISAVNNDLAPVQTNGLPLNLLGVYKDPVFGSQEASILTQVYLATPNPDFGNLPKLDSVVLSIPYFSSEVESESDEAVYQLDSIYGKGAIELTVLHSNFFLNNFDPDTDFQTNKKYFSNLEPEILANASPEVLYYEKDFRPSSSRVIEYSLEEDGEVADTVELEPRMRLHLNKNFFQTKILDRQGSPELSSQNNFRNYFRGIYIQAEETGGEGLMMLLDLKADAGAGITLYYTSQVADTEDRDDDGNITEKVAAHGSYMINFGPTRVNTFDQEVDIMDESNLYLKGGEGSMAIVELFSGPDADDDGVSDELEFLRDGEWLINEAHLEFSVNHDLTAGSNEPHSVYLYNLETYEPIIDYYQLDAAGNVRVARDGTPYLNPSHTQKLDSMEYENQTVYRIRVTEHIDQILNSDGENAKLGLVVSQGAGLVTNSAVLPTEEADVERVPTTSVISPEGTVLYGPYAEDAGLRPVLRIYYTESKE